MAKIPGSILDFSDERIDALMRQYHLYLSSAPFIRTDQLFSHIVAQPCPRFWVSPVRAYVVIGQMLKGDPLGNMRPSKREMFQEIFSRVLALRPRFPSLPLLLLVERVVFQPAPKFYLSPSSARIMVYKAKKKWYARKRHLIPSLRPPRC